MALSLTARDALASACAVVYVAALPVMFVVFAHTRSDAALVAIVVLIGLVLVDLATQVPLAMYAHLTRRRVPYIERMPADMWSSLVGMPVAATVGAALGATAPDLLRDARTFPAGIALMIAALTIPLVVVYVSASRATAERSGRALALHDDRAPAAARLVETANGFDWLLRRKRYLLARPRQRWLGGLDQTPNAWPSARRAWSRFTAPRWVIPGVVVAAAVVGGGITASAVESARRWGPDAVAGPVLAAVPALAVALRVFRVATEEQAEADRLRGVYVTLTDEVATSREPVPAITRNRWRRAFEALVGRDG